MHDISEIRKEYSQQTLQESGVEKSPFKQFDLWWAAALKAEMDEVNAMTLATASVQGRPSARIVLLKGYDENGFVFFSNYESNKGRDLEENPQASLVFFWPPLERQIRIDGWVEKLPGAESDAYFQTRPLGSRIGAWASPQSRVLKSRDEIEKNLENFQREFAQGNIPRPSHWGGYRVKPQRLEFWQGRPDRLHDRIQYSRTQDDNWLIERLAP